MLRRRIPEYPQVIEQWKAYGRLSGDRNESEFAAAAEQGFRSAGWKGALSKGIQIRQAQRRNGYSYAYNIAAMYVDSGNNERAIQWLNTAYQEHDWRLMLVNTVFLFDPMRSIRGLWNWCARSDYRVSKRRGHHPDRRAFKGAPTEIFVTCYSYFSVGRLAGGTIRFMRR